MKKNILFNNLLRVVLALIFMICLSARFNSQDDGVRTKVGTGVRTKVDIAAIAYRAFINEAANDILSKLAEEEGKDKAILDGQLKNEQNAQENLNEIKKEKANAEKTLGNRRKAELAAMTVGGIERAGGGTKSIAIETAITNRAETEQQVADLTRKEREAEKQFSAEQAERKKIEQENQVNAKNRDKQKTELIAAVKKWQNDPTYISQAELDETITTISCSVKLVGNVLFQTTGGAGAIVYFQTLRSRERGDAPSSITNPTETTEDVCYGRYYMWSVRNNQITSNKDKDYLVKAGNQTIRIAENSQKNQE